MRRAHAMPFGAETLDDQRTRFRLWAPSARSVELILINDQGESQIIDMPLRNEGWRERIHPAVTGTRYRLELYRKLLALRHEHVVPRLIKGDSGRHSAISDSTLQAAWQLGDGSSLSTVLNLSSQKRTAQAPPRGELLHCEPASAAIAFNAGELPPNAAAVYLSRADGAY